MIGRRAREPHTLAGAYAMDALDEKDRTGFERHLTRCEACAREVGELRETAARLAVASAAPPPPGLKERVLAAAARTRQQAPAVPAPARRLVRPLVAATAVALVVLTVVFGLSSSDAHQRLDQMRQREQAIAAVLSAHDARMMTTPVTGGGTATIVMSHREGALVFTASGLPALPPSRGYELWLAGPAGQRPAGMLPAGNHGPVFATGLRAGDHLMLTVEPATGASHPTAPAMLDVSL